MKPLPRTWIEAPGGFVPESILNLAGGSDLVGRRMVNLGITHPEDARAFLDPDDYSPASPDELPDLTTTVDRLERAIRKREPICVWGDFDVDGQTSTTLLVSVIRSLGGVVSSHIPIRASESHGINIPVLDRILDRGISLILTCDTGVSALEAVQHAHARGAEVWVTDHHDLPEILPPAMGIVNPKRLQAGHPLSSLPGVGVAYQVGRALALRFAREDLSEETLDLAALGIVADVAEIKGDTRYLLQRGLRRLQDSARVGLSALYEASGLSPTRVSEEHIGFTIAPRMNALGRLGDANSIVEFLTTKDPTRARIMAAELEGLNAKRRLLCEQVYQAAHAQLNENPALLDGFALVLSHPTWPAGVIGIVASRLVEEYNRPTILIASPPGETARGSARSVPGCNITAAIAENKALLGGFGGHPMAAGLGLDPENIPRFRSALNLSVRKMLGDTLPTPELVVDAQIQWKDISLDLVETIERLAPFGNGNPALVLSSPNLVVKQSSRVGKNGEHLQVIVTGEDGTVHKAIWWQGGSYDLPQGNFDLAYSLRATDFHGSTEVQIEWNDARVIESKIPEILPEKIAYQPLDLRRSTDALRQVKEMVGRERTQVWAEGKSPSGVESGHRHVIEKAETLVVWSAPPGYAEIQAVLDRVTPRQVVWVAQDPGLDEFEPFIKRLTGLVKYSLRDKGGSTGLDELASAMAHRTQTVAVGLDWLEAKGWIQAKINGNEVLLAEGIHFENDEKKKASEAQLRALLGETAAFREFVRVAGIDTL